MKKKRSNIPNLTRSMKPVKYKIPWLKKPTKTMKSSRRNDIPKGMKATYNILATPKVLEAFHPQFIGIDKDLIRNISDKNDAVEIDTKPARVKVTLFKGKIPITHVNVMKLKGVI